MVLIVSVSTYWALLNAPLPPETKKKDLVFIDPVIINIENEEAVSWWAVRDDSIRNTILSYDLSNDGVENKTTFTNPMGWRFHENYREMYYTVCTTDDNFFNIFDFNFIQGSGYSGKMTSSEGAPVVITSDVAIRIFGTTRCIGSKFANCIVSGVVRKQPGPWSLFFPADIFELKEQKDFNSKIYTAILSNGRTGKAELAHTLEKISKKISNPGSDYRISLESRDFLTAYAKMKNLDNFLDPIITVPLIILVLLLPLATMVSIVKGMLLSKRNELAVRKSFGATRGHIMRQIIVECTLLVIVSGLLAIILSVPFWTVFMKVDLVTVVYDILSWRVFALTLLTCTLTGGLVGALTSLKLSKGNIVSYLEIKPA